MGVFGDLSLGVKLVIVLGCLLAAVFIAGVIKLGLNRRRLNRKLIEEANRPTDKEKLVPKELSEGNLFGVRAIQNGCYGGVAQRPSSPSPSYRLAPEAAVVDWGKEGKIGSSQSSISPVPRAQMKRSPLRLERQDAKYNPSSVGGMGGSYMPPLPSPRSNRVESPMGNDCRPAGWVSPLDVHFSRPSTPGTPATQYNRPNTYLLKLNLELGKTGTLMHPSPEAKSEVASSVNSGVTTPVAALSKSPGQPTMPSARSAQKPFRSVFPTEEHPGARFQTSSVPLKHLPPPVNIVDSGSFPSDNRRWRPASPSLSGAVVKTQWRNAIPAKGVVPTPIADRRPLESSLNVLSPRMSGTPTLPLLPADIDVNWDRSQPVIRNSAASKRVSVIQPELATQIEPNGDRRVHQIQNRPKNLESLDRSVRMSSHAADIVFSQDSTSPDSLYSNTQATQGTPRHDRSIFDGLVTLGKEQHHLPERDSPFSNSHATSNPLHSANSSFSSYLGATSSAVLFRTDTNKSQTSHLDLENFPFPASPRPPPQSHGFHFALPPILPKPTNHLQVASHIDRPTSGASQDSMGDFYDSYYVDYDKPTPLSPTHGRSVQAQTQSSGANLPKVGTSRRTPPRRPAPLDLGKLGKQYVGNETVEGTTPTTGAFGPGNGEIFPTMI